MFSSIADGDPYGVDRCQRHRHDGRPPTSTMSGSHMSINLPDVISRYFERDTDRDIDSIVNLLLDPCQTSDPRDRLTQDGDEAPEEHGPASVAFDHRLGARENVPGRPVLIAWR